ncbi:LytR C-terminal domain-containing protein [Candidatus Gottesmanbacteria bacterium]|nr:LytR C-terminal domain-containing protein [Candidatus Gottesmanbacteria bacterium]MBI5465468.1 LytR C-terminal domain-containing protein [Candidatus Gottesmanbacteria bacterium]
MKLPRWKREQRARQRQKFAILVRSAVLLSLLFLVFLAGFLVLKEARSSSLAKDGRTTIVLATEPVLVVSFESGEDLTILSIPEKTYIEVLRGFGSYRIGAVWGLGEIEKKGGELLAETSQEFLGVPVDGWIGLKNGKWQSAQKRVPAESANGKIDKEQVINLKNKFTSWGILIRPRELLNFSQNLKTNLTIFDLARIWWWVKTIRFDKIHFLDLGQTEAISSLILADGSTALTADFSLLDTTYQGLFKDKRIAGEHISIEVLNGTDKQGLGQRITRLITNLGGSVISVGNSPQKTGQCQIRGETGILKTLTARRLGQIFDCKMLVEKPLGSRSDLQLIIGEDYWQKLYQ